MNVLRCDFPFPSQIQASLAHSDFADCYQFEDHWPEKNAIETYLLLFARTPVWMNTLMTVRNLAVRLVGLKHLGTFDIPPDDLARRTYLPGQRVGIFSVELVQDDEVIMFDDDKHLKVQISLVKHQHAGRAMISISTVVHIHNRLGTLYMAIVGPVHQLIVPRMLAQVAHA
jgi:Protein of unknown function (DUF2867)